MLYYFVLLHTSSEDISDTLKKSENRHTLKSIFAKISPMSYFVGQSVELVLAPLVHWVGWVVQAMLAGMAD